MKKPPEKQQSVILSETELVQRLVCFLAEDGYRVKLEVPNMGQSADVVATRNRWITAIEAKIRDWRRAIEQCRAHEHFADFICLAVGGAVVSPALLKEAGGLGYGIIHCSQVDGNCVWVLLPQRNRNVWQPQRKRMRAALRTIDYVH